MRKAMMLSLFLGLFLGFGWLQSIGSQAEAACGAAVSSCKTCHETQGQKPVNKTGAWHTDHAFGDFCENCHAGSVSQTDKTAAHTGMHPVLTQAEQSCASCHEADLAARVAKYGGKAEGAATASSAAGGSDNGSSVPPPPPAGGSPQDLIDFNKEWLKNHSESSTWNLVLFGINLLLLGGFGYMVYAMGKNPAKETAEALEHAAELTPEMHALALKLARCDYDTLKALDDLLARGVEGRDLIRRVARLQPEVAESLARLDKEEQALVLMLAAKQG